MSSVNYHASPGKAQSFFLLLRTQIVTVMFLLLLKVLKVHYFLGVISKGIKAGNNMDDHRTSGRWFLFGWHRRRLVNAKFVGKRHE